MDIDSFPLRFGAVVRRLRTEKGLSQEGFADVCGLHRTHMGLIERGKGGISFATALRVATGLNLPLSSLILLVEQEVQMKTERD